MNTAKSHAFYACMKSVIVKNRDIIIKVVKYYYVEEGLM